MTVYRACKSLVSSETPVDSGSVSVTSPSSGSRQNIPTGASGSVCGTVTLWQQKREVFVFRELMLRLMEA
ncbi:hypothetical protein F2P81_015747 [Scophthalmus maximus]|uniref:Uncharacterized protein n=1 Tax=Scophthalmus maximus TaxID=52904 RepID=A0A6A4SLK3_SCOMX|nr:hypothetical protein F2P81_015747 [Scophthalmus maximus]